MKKVLERCLALVLVGAPLLGCVQAEEESAELDEGEASQEGAVALPAAEREAQGIVTRPVEGRALAVTITAPGEVRTNAYRSALVTPRISAQVVARHAHLGDTVRVGAPLVTLSSVLMADAQGALIETDREWRRVQELGAEAVSEARYIAAQVARQRAYAAAAAYGMTEAQIERLLESGDASGAMGEFELLSPQAGTVIQDNFVVGEIIEPGRTLFEISDESVLWVEAQLSSMDAARVMPGTAARVSRDGTRWLDGTVVQLQHRLDETTRTRGVRIEVENRAEALYAGDYVDVELEATPTIARIAVPNDSVVLMDGSSVVFKLDAGQLRPQLVEIGASSSGWTEIKAGLAVGDEVVTEGAFLIKSLLLKSQIGDAD